MVLAPNLERSTLPTQIEFVADNLLPHLVSSRIQIFVRTGPTHLKCASLCLKIIDGPPVGELHGPVIDSRAISPWALSPRTLGPQTISPKYLKSQGPKGRGPKTPRTLGPRPLGPWDLEYMGPKVRGPKVQGPKVQCP